MGRWADLPSNRWIAKADVLNGSATGAIAVIGATPSLGSEQFLSRAQLEAWVSCTGTGASNQFQVKSGASFSTSYAHTIYAHTEVGYNTTTTLGCAETSSFTVYSTCATLNNGCRFSGWTGELWVANGASINDWYKTNDGRVFQLNYDGDILNMQNCASPFATINIYNSSNDIELYIYNMTVNGVAVTDISGGDPVTTGYSATAKTYQPGTYTITMVYNCYSGHGNSQKISLLDSNNVTFCDNTLYGFNSMTFNGVNFHPSTPVTINCEVGMCL